MQLLVFVLASYGVTNIVTAGRLFAGLRSRLAALSPLVGHWVRCPMCTGVPVGVLWALAGLRPGANAAAITDLVAAGVISSGGCWLLSLLARALGGDEM